MLTRKALGALPVALGLALAGPSAALASPSHDYAGSRTPGSARHHVASAPSSGLQRLSSQYLIGPDVSNHDGCSINWSSVASARSFAFMKASEGTNFTDWCFAGNWQRAAAAGLPRGAYDFARPRPSLKSAHREARHFVAIVDAAGGFGRSLPPVLDVEVNDNSIGRHKMRAWILGWIREVRKETGRNLVTIYTGNWFWAPEVGSWRPPGALLWASGYTSQMPSVAGWGTPNWWQYTDGTFGPRPHATPGIGRGDNSYWLGTSDGLTALMHHR